MTATLITNARLIDPEAGHVRDGSVLIEDGVIARVNDDPEPYAIHTVSIRDADGRFLAPGIVDIGVKVSEPGERHKESFRSAALAAAAGGVTTMVTRPDTLPAIDSPETLEFVMRRATEAAPVRVLPMAALTKGRQGREMVEIGFLMDAGAVAFTDCDAVVTDTKVASRCYTMPATGRLVIGHPQDPGLSADAAATSGKFASLRGLPSVSPMAERMGLDRDLALVEMTGVRYHADQITTARALRRLGRAKAAGLDITAGVSIHHLTLNELDVGDYRTFFKVKPPLRSEDDRMAVVEAVAEGLIDVISSMHTPQDEESKRLPFEQAASGAVGLETFLPAALRLLHSGDLDLPTAVPGDVAQSVAPPRPAHRTHGRGRARRSRPVRSGRALRARPLHAALEVEEHALRRAEDAGQGPRHMGRRTAGIRRLTCPSSPRRRSSSSRSRRSPISWARSPSASWSPGSWASETSAGSARATSAPRTCCARATGSRPPSRSSSTPGRERVAVIAARLLVGEDAAQVAAVFAFLGHLWPVWLGFRGGKGVSTFLGTILALHWPLGLMTCASGSWWLSLGRMSSLAGLVAVALTPAIAALFWATRRLVASVDACWC
jgi:dihydroorotase